MAFHTVCRPPHYILRGVALSSEVRRAALCSVPGTRLGISRGVPCRNTRRTLTINSSSAGVSKGEALAGEEKLIYDRRGKLKGKAVAEGPFQELGLKEISDKVGGIRLRQHVNPLKRELQIVSEPPEWKSVYEEPTNNLHVDVGCGPGRFLLMKAKGQPSQNHLGLDIREKLTDRGNAWAKEVGCDRNVHFMMSNATVSLSNILSTYPGQVACVSVQFPDPHFKKRHHKRRIVQPQLVDAVADVLPPGRQVFLQSDVREVAVAMREQFEKYSAGRFMIDTSLHTPNATIPADVPEEDEDEDEDDESDHESSPSAEVDDFPYEWAAHGWLRENPMGVPTEREVYVLNDNLPVYRVMLVRQ
mmetsp:Transcript_11142/g.23250  ORF Transcript_11142/g.23250 Transcript_11142/m.23250 type:complete len:359 (-) Transcript_11142:459-1535(-)|eukprot:CAMPEP_0118929540 /NCGR_PEP_ID=MMETSP1169-20130426/6512_1 /TAXON_ID=36882 /ORGANISM="Pyramimonas obovata, Strain CCMP722" /LENGTH=358 /DNA_ID=CAMNT_0006871753 /DNA_START=91 /DNA_END=1167 /DNA_ORIENTATION=-